MVCRMAFGLKADHAAEERAVLPDADKVVVVAPEFNGLKFISAHHAEVTRRENLYSALGIKDLIALENDPAESVKDRHLRNGMGFEIVAYGSNELGDRAFGGPDAVIGRAR